MAHPVVSTVMQERELSKVNMGRNATFVGFEKVYQASLCKKLVSKLLGNVKLAQVAVTKSPGYDILLDRIVTQRDHFDVGGRIERSCLHHPFFVHPVSGIGCT
jgi:hypothetical protein